MFGQNYVEYREGTQKEKYKNPKVQNCRKCEIAISKNRIIQK